MSEIWSPDVALKEAIEDEFQLPVGESTEEAKAVTGEPYVTLCSGGVKDEGALFPAWYPTPEQARKAYRKAFIEYGISGVSDSNRYATPNRLYWRTPPEMYQRTVYEVVPLRHGTRLEEVTLYSVWSRLLISSKPRMEQVA